MQWDFNRAVFLQHDLIREHAVDSTAERTFVNIGSRLAAAPALKEISSNAIADFYPRHAGADFDHFTGAVGKRDQIFTHRHAITATRNSEVAKIERAGLYSHQDLPIGRLGIRALDLRQGFNASPAFGQLICTHAQPRWV